MTKPGPSDPRDPQGPTPNLPPEGLPPEGRVREGKDAPQGTSPPDLQVITLASRAVGVLGIDRRVEEFSRGGFALILLERGEAPSSEERTAWKVLPLAGPGWHCSVGELTTMPTITGIPKLNPLPAGQFWCVVVARSRVTVAVLELVAKGAYVP